MISCQIWSSTKLEIWLEESSDHLKPSVVASNPDAFCAQYKEMTRLTPVAIYLDEDVPEETFKGLVKLAKLMRVMQITIPASPIGTPFNTAIDRLRLLSGVASEDGIRLSIKTHSEHLTQDPHTAVELCQSVKGLGITLDPSYYICTSLKVRHFDQVFPYVYNVHLRDTTPEEIQVPVGLGEVDYNRLVNQLQKENYNGGLCVDFIPGETSTEDRHLELRKLRRLLDSHL